MAEVTLKSQEQIQRQLQKQKGQFYQRDITLVCREVCPLPPHIRRWLDQNAVVLLLLNCVDVF